MPLQTLREFNLFKLNSFKEERENRLTPMREGLI